MWQHNERAVNRGERLIKLGDSQFLAKSIEVDVYTDFVGKAARESTETELRM